MEVGTNDNTTIPPSGNTTIPLSGNTTIPPSGNNTIPPTDSTRTESIFITLFNGIKSFTIDPVITDARSLIGTICELFDSGSNKTYMCLISAVFTNLFLYLFVILAINLFLFISTMRMENKEAKGELSIRERLEFRQKSYYYNLYAFLLTQFLYHFFTVYKAISFDIDYKRFFHYNFYFFLGCWLLYYLSNRIFSKFSLSCEDTRASNLQFVFKITTDVISIYLPSLAILTYLESMEQSAITLAILVMTFIQIFTSRFFLMRYRIKKNV